MRNRCRVSYIVIIYSSPYRRGQVLLIERKFIHTRSDFVSLMISSLVNERKVLKKILHHFMICESMAYHIYIYTEVLFVFTTIGSKIRYFVNFPDSRAMTCLNVKYTIFWQSLWTYLYINPPVHDSKRGPPKTQT